MICIEYMRTMCWKKLNYILKKVKNTLWYCKKLKISIEKIEYMHIYGLCIILNKIMQKKKKRIEREKNLL